MALTLDQIFSPITVPEAQQFCIDVLKSVGFTGAASWQDGSLARTCGIEVPARVMSNVSALIVSFARGGYNDTAQGDWLTIFSLSHYDNSRFQPVATQGTVSLSTGDMAHSIQPGELVVADEVTLQTFRNRELVTIAAHSTLGTVPVEAESASSASNVPADSITIVQTSHAGLTVTNPGVYEGDWITRVGADQEKDPALQQRNRTKWATKAYATPEAGYENYAREADPAITRVYVDGQNPNGPGSVRIYIAGPQGASHLDSAQAVEDYINGVTDGICRRPLCSDVECVPAADRAITVSGTVYIASAYQGQVEPALTKALDDFFGAIPIGGTKTTSGSGFVFFSQLYMAVMTVPGVVNVVFTNPTGDVGLALDEVPVETLNLTYVVI